MPTVPAYGIGAFSYNGGLPRGYQCAKCKRQGCKLWRPLAPTLVALEPVPLHCADCACKTLNLDPSRIDAKGRLPIRIGREVERIDQIGYWVPAVPTENGADFHGVTLPSEAIAWWHRLPSRGTSA